MAFVSPIPTRRNSHLIPAALALAALGLVAPLHLALGGSNWPLIWLPLAVAAMWPRRASVLPSAVLLLLGGLWVDWVSLGATGQWALVFLLTYALLRPDLAEGSTTILGQVGRCLAALVIGVVVLSLSGRFVYSAWPDPRILLRGAAVYLVMVPPLAFLRTALAARLSGDDA